MLTISSGRVELRNSKKKKNKFLPTLPHSVSGKTRHKLVASFSLAKDFRHFSLHQLSQSERYRQPLDKVLTPHQLLELFDPGSGLGRFQVHGIFLGWPGARHLGDVLEI